MQPRPTTRGFYGWILQRVTGLFLTFFLIVHIDVLHFTNQGIINFDLVTQRLHSSFLWVIFYTLFLPACLFHGLNGLWGIVLDYRPRPNVQKAVLFGFWVIGILTFFWGVWAIQPLIF